MLNPNCTGQDELDLGVIDIARLGRREVQGCFDGGSMTSDAGVMLLPATDHKLGLDDDAATLHDPVYCQRSAAEHRIKEAQVGLFATRTSCRVLCKARSLRMNKSTGCASGCTLN